MEFMGLSSSLLRTLVDFGSYTPDSTSPRWLQGIARVAQQDPGVLALLGPAGLSIESDNIKRTRVVPDTAAVFLSGLVDRLRSTQRHIAIGLPPVARHLPLLLAGSSVLANVVDSASVTSGWSDGSILIVSPDLDARSRYCDLHVGSELLDEAYPGSRMRPDGQRVPLRPIQASRGIHGVCFFLPLLSMPNDIAMRPSTIMLDVRYSRWVSRISDLVSWATKLGGHAGIVALYSLGDTDTRQALIGAGFKDFPFDQAAIVACAQHTQEPPTYHTASADLDVAIAPSYLMREHEVALVSQATEVEHALAAANRLIFNHAQHDSPTIRRARWILATLNHLPVPLVVYEYSARSIGRRPLRSLIDGLDGARQGAYGGRSVAIGDRALKDALDHLYTTLWHHNPREVLLHSILPTIASQQGERQVLVLVRDPVVERAMHSWIADEAFPNAPWIPSLDIQACPSYFKATSHQYRHALVIGAFPRRYSWITGAALAPHVTFVAYRHEIEAIKHQLEGVYGDEARLARAQYRDNLLQELSPSTRTGGGPESTIASLNLVVPSLEPTNQARPTSKKQMPTPKPKVTIRDIRQLSDALQQVAQHQPQKEDKEDEASNQAWIEDLGDDELPEDDAEQLSAPASGYGESQLCVRVRVNSRAFGQGIMWLPQDRAIEVYRQADTDDLLGVTPDKLKPADVILVMRDLERTSLFDRIVQLAESQPEMRYLAARRRVWQDSVRHMAARYTFGGRVDYAQLLRDLQTHGAPIQSELAVRFWIQGDVIGPESLHSIIAVGKASGSSELVQRAREFDQAFRDIRGIRQGIGMRLSAAIRQAFRHGAEGGSLPKTRLNDHLGIAVDELIDSIDLAEILSVDTTSQRVPSHQVGRFLRQ